MAAPCIDTASLKRSGFSQEQRALSALLPSFVSVDERDMADLLLFARKYADFLIYYNKTNQVDGSWQPLMNEDISMILARITKTNVKGYDLYRKELYNIIQTSSIVSDQMNAFKAVFDFMFTLTVQLDEFLRQLPKDFEFRTYCSSAVQSRLSDALKSLMDYYSEFSALHYLDSTSTNIPADAPLPILLSQQFQFSSLLTIWSSTFTTINLSVPNPTDISNSIRHIITHNIFNAQVDSFIKTYSSLVAQAAPYLLKTIDQFPEHSPHFGLFISFLKLFRHQQDELNTFTERHLNFYYQKILQTKVRDPQPDHVHLLIELQKASDFHLISSGTLFKGGKNSSGKDLFYAADQDTVISQAKVKSLKALCKQSFTKGTSFEVLFASAIANSKDGQGAKITQTTGEWAPFGDPTLAPVAKIGFMIGTNHLYLAEGTRKITIRFYFKEALTVTANDLTNVFQFQLTGKKGWYDVPSYTAIVNSSDHHIEFSMTLEGDAPAIIAYSEKVHKSSYLSDLPMIRSTLIMDFTKFNPYTLLQQLNLTSCSIDVEVTGAKDVVIQNDEGVLSASKPFQPFGAQPSVGSSFIIGSNEIFQKHLTELQFNIQWDKLPDEKSDQLSTALHAYELTLDYIKMKQRYHTVRISSLQKGQWKVQDPNKGLFTEGALYENIFNWSRPESKYAGKLNTDIDQSIISMATSGFQPTEINFDKTLPMSTASVSGYVKLDLNSPDFGHSAYLTELKNPKVTVKFTPGATTSDPTTVTTETSVPKEPYTPTIKQFSVNYAASQTVLLEDNPLPAANTEGLFYHLGPFGYKKTSKDDKLNLLPAMAGEGELYIGLDAATADTVVAILFEVADGSSDPLVPIEQLQFSYLSSNHWKDFDDVHAVVDGSHNMTQSGIVHFSLPSDLTTGNTWLDATQSWLRIAVPTNLDAVCNLIDVQAQAIQVTLLQDKTKGITYSGVLKSSTISKLKSADASIKKISQPYDSFGGRIAEQSDHYFTRLSERLRHKGRAIAVWDYERLILEAFPAIYKVKCIAHTGQIAVKIGTKYSETAPGYVTVVTVPDIRNHTRRNFLRPYTPVGLLQNIQDFLVTLISPFVQLQITNPKFEELQFEFTVVFNTDDKVFYERQLNLDIEQFLCPWAYSDAADIEFGGKISKSVVLNFIEDRSYVDYVMCFKMHHIVERGVEEYHDVEEASTTTGISILISYYDETNGVRHLINQDPNCIC